MANRQKPYIRIANELFDAIMQTDFTKRQIKILDFVIRMSYGCGRESALLRPVDFELVGIYKSDIRKELSYLEKSGVLLLEGEAISLNPDFRSWRVSSVRLVDQERWQRLIKRNLDAARAEGKTPRTTQPSTHLGVSEVPPAAECSTDPAVSETSSGGACFTAPVVGEIVPLGQCLTTGEVGERSLPSTLKPSADKACHLPKEQGKAMKDIGKEKGKPNLPEILAQYPRYNPSQLALLQEYWEMIRQVRRVGEVSTYTIKHKMQQWQSYPAELVLQAIEIHLSSHRDKQEAYTDGIIKRLLREQNSGATAPERSYTHGQTGTDPEPHPLNRSNRYAHLLRGEA